MKNIMFWGYGTIAYLLGLFALLWFIAFTLGITPDGGVDRVGKDTGVLAWLINIGLIGLFGVQHSVMARPQFKHGLEKILSPALERSTYLIASAIPLVVLVICWQPITGNIWQLSSPLLTISLYGLAGLGWGLVFLSTFLISHLDLFGLRQIYFHLSDEAYQPLEFRQPSIYKRVRHPMQLGVIIGIWATPSMSASHLLLAIGMTSYILVGLYYEERELLHAFGEQYRAYQKSVPKLIPQLFGR